MQRKRTLVALAACALLAAGMPAVTVAQTPGPTTSSDCRMPDKENDAFFQATSLRVGAPRGTLALVSVADEATRERGLMCVTKIPHGRGMIFVFPGPDNVRGFWMKDTLVNLDMVFVDSDHKVTAVSANVPATKEGTPDAKIARREGLGSYVIELGAGDAARYGIKIGTKLSLPVLKAVE